MDLPLYRLFRRWQEDGSRRCANHLVEGWQIELSTFDHGPATAVIGIESLQRGGAGDELTLLLSARWLEQQIPGGGDQRCLAAMLDARELVAKLGGAELPQLLPKTVAKIGEVLGADSEKKSVQNRRRREPIVLENRADSIEQLPPSILKWHPA